MADKDIDFEEEPLDDEEFDTEEEEDIEGETDVTDDEVDTEDDADDGEDNPDDGIEDKEMVEISVDKDTGDVAFKFHVGDKESAPQDRAGAVSVLDSVDGYSTDDEPVDVEALLDEAEDVGSVEFWVSPEDREKIEGWMV